VRGFSLGKGNTKVWSVSIIRLSKTKVVLTTLLFISVGVTSAFSLAPLQTWNLTSTSANWKAVACSDTCLTQYAAVYSGYIFKSTDGGGSWSQLTSAGSRYWNSLATSGDGNYVSAVDYAGYLYRSADGGTSWTQSGVTGNWRAIAMNQVGDIQLAAITGGNLYVSADYGQSWSAQSAAGTASWGALDINASGTVAVAGGKPGNIWIGTNTSGSWSWSNKTGSGQTASSGTDSLALNLKGWSGFVLSETGTRIVAVNDSGSSSGQGNIFYSSDTGTTWTEVATGNFGWQAVAGTSDLMTIMTGSSNGCGSSCRLHYRTASTFGSWSSTFVGAYSATAYQIAVAKDGSRGVAPIYGAQLQYAGTVILPTTATLSFNNGFFRTALIITATVSPTTGGKTTFYANGKKISGCISKITSGSSVTCSYKPSKRGFVDIYAVYKPTDNSYTQKTSVTSSILVSARTTNR
jgi:hypothetical protein